MDQDLLVAEQINAGGRLAGDFSKYTSLQAAFWLKESDDAQWYLYLASDQINDSNFDRAYGEVLRLLGRGPHMWLDPFQVKVIGTHDPLAKAVLGVQQRYPGTLPTRLRNCMLGGVSVDAVYIYPIPIPVSG